MAYNPNQPDPARTDNRGVETKPSGAGRTLLVIAIIAVLALAAAWALGLFNVDTSGSLEAPNVEVSGGEVPNVEVETADINVGSKEATVEVPTVEVTKPGDDGKAE